MLRLSERRDGVARLLSAAGNAVLAVATAILGLFLGKVLVSPRWTAPVTAVGITLHTMLILANPFLGFLVWIVYSPFGRFTYQVISMGGGVPDLTLDRLVVGLLVTLVLAQLATGQRRGVSYGRLELFTLIYVAAMGLSVHSSLLGRVTALQNWFDVYAVPFLVYLLAKNLIGNRRDMRAAVHALIIISLYLALLATREQITGDIWFYPPDRSIVYTANVRRVVALLGNPAYIALIINMTVPFVAWLFVTAHTGARKLLYLGILGVQGLGVFMCYNRAGWLGFVVALLVLAVLSPQFRRYYLPALIVAGVVLAVAGTAIVADPRVAQRLYAWGPIEYRQRVLAVVLPMIRDHLLLGVGFGNFMFYFTRYAYWSPYLRALPTPHNNVLLVTVTAGLPVGICYVMIFVTLFLDTLRLYRQAGRGTFPDRTLIAALWAACAVYLVTSMTMDAILGSYASMILSLIMGMTLGAWGGRVMPALSESTRGA